MLHHNVQIHVLMNIHGQFINCVKCVVQILLFIADAFALFTLVVTLDNTVCKPAYNLCAYKVNIQQSYLLQNDVDLNVLFINMKYSLLQ